ncbi:MAG: ABC transporter permease [Actinomycetota bacterium]
MRSFISVTLAVAGRNLKTALRNPSLLFPPLIAPLIFFAVFAGGLGTLGRAPGFDFPAGYTSFSWVFMSFQAAAFNGVFAGFSLAQDYERGFTPRLMLAAPRRGALISGYALSALARTALSLVILFVAGVLAGMRLEGSALEIAGIFVLALAFGVVASLWGVGVAFRTRTIQAAPGMQIPIFLAMFFAPAFVPLALLTGWIHGVATYNPVTYLLEAGRGFIAGHPTDVVRAWTIVAVLLPLLTLWARLGLRRAERSAA